MTPFSPLLAPCTPPKKVRVQGDGVEDEKGAGAHNTPRTQVDIISPVTTNTMGYIHDFEQELRTRLERGFTEDDIKWVKETVLQSYRNGVEARGESEPTEATSPNGAKHYKRYKK